MKKKSLVILMLIVLLTMLSGCAFFESDAEGVKDIELSRNEDNDIVVKVLYYDEFDSFKEEIIPTGLDGRDGVGIESIEVVREKESLRNKIIIRLTPKEGQEKGEETILYVPDGVRIEGITSRFDEGTDKYYMTLKYTDGEESDPIEIPQGKTGNGIDVSKSTFDMQEDGSINVVLTFTDGNTQEFTIPAGKTGNGIQSIEPDESNGTLTLTITYTDGEIVPISFTRTSFWYQGVGAPTLQGNAEIVQNAIKGDYYLDIYSKKIYAYTDYGWEIMVDFAQSNDVFTVTFNANDDPESPAEPFNNRIPNIKYGEYLAGRIPVPVRDGYTFKGWATSAVLGPTTGFFTDLTPVMANLTLFAIWEQN